MEMKFFALLLGSCVLAGCGGGNTGAAVQGVASKGPLNGATVCAYAIGGNGTRGAQIGSCARTDAAGNYRIALGNYSGAVLFQASGGTYTDEATGTTMPLAVPLNSVVADAAEAARGVAITALTELAYRHANALQGGLTPANLQAATSTVQTSFGVADILHTMPVDALQLPGAATNDQKAYALALATVSQFANQQAASSLANALQSMAQCLALPATQCGNSASSMGALMDTALNTFVGNHPDFGAVAGPGAAVGSFGLVSTLPGTNGAGQSGVSYAIPGVGGQFQGGYLELSTANGHAALYVTCNYGSPGDNEAFFFATDPSVTPGSIQVTVAIDGQPGEVFNDLGYNMGGQDRAFAANSYQGTWPWHGTFATNEGGTLTAWDISVSGSSTGNCTALVYGGSNTAGRLVQP